ncbi:diguanylate cyclase [Pseudomonas luteola]
MYTLSDYDRAQVLQQATAEFWKYIIPIVKIAFAIHIALLVLFWILDITALLLVNTLSVLAYLVCLRAVRHKQFHAASIVMSVEIITHAIVATWVLGWESNFYFYLFCIIPVIAFSFQTYPKRHFWLSMAILGVVTAGFCLRRYSGASIDLEPYLLETFGIVNAFIATCMLLYATALSVFHALSMQFGFFHIANRDSLTNLYMRRSIFQRLDRIGPLPLGSSTAIILLDIDHFKQINDHFGHDFGDLILQRVASAIANNVRESDMASRWGG